MPATYAVSHDSWETRTAARRNVASLERLGLLKTSLIDYPGEVAAVVFTPGCNLRCPYCHNPRLVSGRAPDDFLPRERVLDVLDARAHVLTGVCVTGGEPLVHEELPELIDAVRALGLRVKLDTNGMLPDRLARVSVDFVALDLKLAPRRYRELGGPADAAARLADSIAATRAVTPDYEFRTTVVPGLVRPADVAEIATLLAPSETLVLAPFRPGDTLDPRLAAARAPADELLERCVQAATRAGVGCRVRGRRG
ncbi:MAG: anaerobic ribonucleoside-triphosphate reductase activating protein [Spirochaetota bacterium]